MSETPKISRERAERTRLQAGAGRLPRLDRARGREVHHRQRALVGRLAGSVDLELVANLGVNGYSSAQLIDHQQPLTLVEQFLRYDRQDLFDGIAAQLVEIDLHQVSKLSAMKRSSRRTP